MEQTSEADLRGMYEEYTYEIEVLEAIQERSEEQKQQLQMYKQAIRDILWNLRKFEI